MGGYVTGVVIVLVSVFFAVSVIELGGGPSEEDTRAAVSKVTVA